MTSPFVWFDNLNAKSAETAQFFAQAFGWQQNDIGSMIMQMDGDNGPFAGVCAPMEGITGWVPYVKVDDLAAETEKALGLGATLIAKDKVGPAGTANFIKDPGGNVLALWKQGETGR